MVLRYSLLWFLLAIIAITNGVLRVTTYGKIMSELSAHQISTVTCIVFSGLFVFYMNKIWPIESLSQAWLIGFIWLISTILFEFVFGHFVMGHTWEILLRDYNLKQGRVWLLFLIWILVMPVVIYKYA